VNVHSGQLERWLGAEAQQISRAMRGWYGPPIALANVPGSVFAHGDGDFSGTLKAGYECSWVDRAQRIVARFKRNYIAAARSRHLNVGFSSLAHLLESGMATSQYLGFSKVDGAMQNAGDFADLWTASNVPPAGAAGGAAPGGTVHTNADAGALKQVTSTDLLFVTNARINSTVVGSLLLYDRLFSVAKTASSTATEAVTGVPTRYQSTVATDPDYIGGNFVFPANGAVLGGTAHNWTVCTYVNETLSGATIPSIAGLASGSARRVDLPAGSNWFMPLAGTDAGVQALTQMQCSASVTGAVNFVIGHPLAWFGCAAASWVMLFDGIATGFNFARVFDGAALSFLSHHSTTGGPTVNGHVQLVSAT
jgi:hypothetical protein